MASKKSSANFKERRLFGRRSGKALNKSRAEALEVLLPALCVTPEQMERKAALPVASLFEKPFDQYAFEIGFGTGEHLHGLMERHPDIGFIGAEPFVNGMATFLRDITGMPHDNVRVHMDDALLLVEALEDACLDKIYVLNPDPWHKNRHHKRRIIREDTLDQFARILKNGGTLISSTDVPYLAKWIIEKTIEHPSFTWADGAENNIKTEPDWWIENRYATKGAKGASEMHYLIFHKT